MRNILLFLLVTAYQGYSGITYSQYASISLNLKNSTLEEVFNVIEKQSEFFFLVNKDLVDLNTEVSISMEEKTINEILSSLFIETNIDYMVSDRQIIVAPVEHLVGMKKVFNSVNVSKIDSKVIRGAVTDISGETLIGVSVRVLGTSIGAITDINGRYAVLVPYDSNVLIFSYVGMKSKEVIIGDKTIIDVVLEMDVLGMDEVIVIGYGTMKKSDINAAIVSVNPEELVKVSSPNITNLLAGRAAGVTVIQGSAQPGGNAQILIRGAASTGAGNDPLYVIDGFPVVNAGVYPGSGNHFNAGSRSPLNDINPNDIESIEILKDASATAIYGARGANGVILITTKRGRTGTHVEYNVNSSFQVINNRPELLNAHEYMIEQNNYLYERFLMVRQAYPYGPRDPETVGIFIPKHTEDDIAQAGTGTDWYDLISQTGRINQHNLTIHGGDENSRSLLSFNYFDQEGIIRTSALTRYSIRYNADKKITNWWDIGLSSSASYTNEQNAALGGGRDATAGIIESAMNYSPFIVAERDPFTNSWVEDPNQPLLNHPLSFLDIEDHTKTNRFLINAFSNLYFQENLWLRMSGGFDFRKGLRQNYYPQTTRYGRQIGGDANINNQNREDYLAEAILNYQTVLNEKHSFYAIAGYSLNIQNGDGSSARAMGFSTDALSYYALQAGEQIPIVSSYKNRHILASYLTRLQYAYDNKYLLTFTGRVDGSDRFGENNRYAFFPSGAFAWRISSESFMSQFDWVTDLKLRLSVGQVGNENIANDAASEYYSFQGRNYILGDSERRGVNLAKIGNPYLKWETTTEYNIGVDFGFFNNRLSGSLEVFDKQIADLLTNRALPINSVVGSIPWNVGKTQSSGVELTLKSVNLAGQLKWESLLTYTSYNDRWLERDSKVILLPYQGDHDPIRSVFALIPDGIKKPDQETPHMPALRPGQQIFKDVNGLDEDGNLTGQPDGRISEADVVFIGTQDPKFTAGLYNTFSYKNFDLNMFIYCSYGALKWPTTRIEHSVYGSYGVQQFTSNYNFLKEVSNRWSSQNMDSDMPNGEVNSSSFYGAPYWEDASYVRLKDVSFGFDFSELINITRVYSARLYISAQNLITITNYNGLDPEVEINRAAYPQQRTFSVGFDVKF